MKATFSRIVLAKMATASAASLSPFEASLDVRNITQPGHSSGVLPCDALRDAGLGDRVISPLDEGYEPAIETWFAENSRLRPYCLVLPHNTHEVSQVLTALVGANDGAGDWHIAVRSGGHSMGAISNIAQGVTIDLTLLNSTTYDEATNIASIQPGARWKDAFADLDEYGVTATGGRDGGVGVGGFLLGGGMSFFSGRTGFGCDSIVNYEVVLADGIIVNANSTSNPDLWRALKGGASNFGIVTRFDIEAIPAHKMYHDIRFISSQYSDTVVDTVAAFTDHDDSVADDALVTFFSHNATVSPDIYIGMIHVNSQGNANSSAVFNEVRNVPTMLNITNYRTMSEVAESSQVPPGSRSSSATLTFRNDPEFLRQCVDIYVEHVESLKQILSPDAFYSMMFFQPMPSYLTDIGAQRGGNMLGLERAEGNMILWDAGVLVGADDQAGYAKAHALLMTMVKRVKELSVSVGTEADFVYLNYADASQDPIGSYGEGNIAFMKEVAQRYDPMEVFQKRVPGGFKVSRV